MRDMYSDADFYDAVTGWKTDDIPFFIKYAQQTDSPIVELAAGTGRIAVPLIENGFQYTGIDLSPDFVNVANNKIESFGDLGEFIVGDMRNFTLPKKYNLIFVGFNSIFHLMDEDEILSCLACVHKHLNAKGKFLIDMFVPNSDYLYRDPDKFYPVGEYIDHDGNTIIVKEKNKYDAQTEINYITWYAFYNGKSEPDQYSFNHFMIPPVRIQRLLLRSGFTIENIFSSYDEKPFDQNSKLQIYICRK